MAPSLSNSDNALINKLLTLSNDKGRKKLVSSSTYAAPNALEVTIRSWKMNEFKYYDVPSPFPTLARGLFTTWISDEPGGSVNENVKNGGDAGRYRIVARGYDKFFNIGEVPWTTWAALGEHTVGPYVMTLKSNGCIIFIGALTPTKLLVTSKHSLGPIQGVPVSHAQMGENWLLKHLEKSGNTTEQLASVLWEENLTAVAELCDDSFEEHVLPYSTELTGLHLHGLNQSTGNFNTRPSEEVNAFAREWGFIETAYHTVNSISEVKSFSEEVAKTGEWKGQAIEGFVVRCHVADQYGRDSRSIPPYPPRSSFFFKVKYDEPYMMYRDWREVTKMLLSTKGRLEDVKIPKSKLRRPETNTYITWVKNEITRDRSQFENYNKGKGIIATRERFLKWLETSSVNGSVDAELLTEQIQQMSLSTREKKFGKSIILPVAIPGCGKTTIAVALTHLFGFGHVQSDDIHAKKAAPIFIRKVVEGLGKSDVVIADKNNHLRQHRQELANAVASMSPRVRLLALNWALDKPPARIHRICGDRVMDRGDNHQTLRADNVAKTHEGVIWKFINSTEELAEDEVDEVVEMDVEDDLEASLERAVDACVRVLGLERPSQEEVAQALSVARAYKPAKKKEDQKSKVAKPRYYAFQPEVDVGNLVGGRLSEDGTPEQMSAFWDALEKNKRVASVPHVTVVHTKSLPQEQTLWDRCEKLFLLDSPPLFDLELGDIICNKRVMTITIKDIKPHVVLDEDTDVDAQTFMKELDGRLRQKLHITVGTASGDISPFEARALVEEWKLGKRKEDVWGVSLENVVVKGRVKGMFS